MGVDLPLGGGVTNPTSSTPSNSTPTSNAGTDRSGRITTTVSLDGSASTDPDLMRYEPESLPSGLCVINNDPTSGSDLGCD